MRVIKDTPFEFGYLVWQLRPPTPSLMVVIKGTFSMVHDRPCTIAGKQRTISGEQHYDNEPQNSVRIDTDFAVTKPHGECFLAGTCHPPGGVAVAQSAVAFQVGSVKKALAVYGDRTQRRGLVAGVSKPRPFTSMPLKWELSLGAPNFAKNPVGIGLRVEETPDGPLIRWPNIEDPRALLTELSSRAEPAGAFPILKSWDVRTRKCGTLDQRWVDTRWPWFPDDFDWTFFNAAPLDQQIRGYWRGDEQLAAQNLHPEHVMLRTSLPGLKARAFLEIRRGDAVDFVQVPLHLDTITLDTDALEAICLWRGVVDVPSEELREVQTLFYVHEPIAEQHPIEHYQAWLARKRDEEAQEEKAFEPEPVAATEGAAADGATAPEVPALAAPAVPDADQDPIDMLVGDLTSRSEATRQRGGPDADVELAVLGDMIAKLKESKLPEPPAPPPPKPSEVRAALAGEGLELAQTLEDIPDPPDEVPPSEETELPEQVTVWTRAMVLARHAAGEAFAGEDLSGVDLSGEDLSAYDFSKSLLQGADLSRCVLRGTKFDECVLDGAVFDEAIAVKASFKGASMEGVRGARANFEAAVFDDADGPDVRFDHAQFVHASLVKTDFSGGHFAHCSFREATMSEADLSRGIATGADFTQANLVDAWCDGLSAVGAVFEAADLTKFRGSENADFTDCNFRKINGTLGNWVDAKLNSANFSLSNLEGADFTNAGLVQANLDGCEMKDVRFQQSLLVNASMLKSNAMGGNFEGADLSHADLRGTNLFGANMWRAKIDYARLELANLQQTTIASRDTRRR